MGGNPQPIFSLEAKVNSFSLLGKEKQHLKIILENSHKSLDAIGFGLGEYYDKLLQGQEIIAAGSLDINKWNNNIKAQLIIKDLKSSLEDELKYNYFISLYNLFLSLDDEATLLDYQSLKKISLDEIQNLEDSLILVQSLDSLLRLIRDFDNIKIMFNNESKICYTNKYDLNSKIEILVNPIMDKVNFSKYKTIVLYDSLWINKSFVVEEDKKEKFLKLKKQ